MENEEINVDKEHIIDVLIDCFDETDLGLMAYDYAKDKSVIEKEVYEDFSAESLWFYLDDETRRDYEDRREVEGDLLGPLFSASQIVENADRKELLEMITENTDLTIEDIINYK